MMALNQSGESTMRANKENTSNKSVSVSHSGLRRRRLFMPALAMLLLGGCTVGPKYVRPTADVPSDFKENANWKTVQPGDETAKGKWWEVYQDPQLNELEEKVDVSNQSLKAAQA